MPCRSSLSDVLEAEIPSRTVASSLLGSDNDNRALSVVLWTDPVERGTISDASGLAFPQLSLMLPSSRMIEPYIRGSDRSDDWADTPGRLKLTDDLEYHGST